MARNEHKKLTEEDEFARKYFGKHARLGTIRSERKRNKKKMRKYNKKLIKEEFYEKTRMD